MQILRLERILCWLRIKQEIIANCKWVTIRGNINNIKDHRDYSSLDYQYVQKCNHGAHPLFEDESLFEVCMSKQLILSRVCRWGAGRVLRDEFVELSNWSKLRIHYGNDRMWGMFWQGSTLAKMIYSSNKSLIVSDPGQQKWK